MFLIYILSSKFRNLDTDQETWSVRFPHDKKFLEVAELSLNMFQKWPVLRFWMRTALSVYVRFFFLFSFNWEGGIHIIYLGLCVLQNSSHFLVIRRLLYSLWICFRNKPYYCLDENGFISTSQVYSNAHTFDFFWKISKLPG